MRRTGHEAIVRLLLEAGADKEAKDKDGDTPHLGGGEGHGRRGCCSRPGRTRRRRLMTATPSSPRRRKATRLVRAARGRATTARRNNGKTALDFAAKRPRRSRGSRTGGGKGGRVHIDAWKARTEGRVRRGRGATVKNFLDKGSAAAAEKRSTPTRAVSARRPVAAHSRRSGHTAGSDVTQQLVLTACRCKTRAARRTRRQALRDGSSHGAARRVVVSRQGRSRREAQHWRAGVSEVLVENAGVCATMGGVWRHCTSSAGGL